MRRCRRMPPHLAASGLIVNGVVLHRGPTRLTIPDRHWPRSSVFKITFLIASRTSSATLRPERAAALRNAASSSFGRYTWVFSMCVTLVLILTYVKSRAPWRSAAALPGPQISFPGSAFGDEHERTYGHRATGDEPVKLVSMAVLGEGLRDGAGVPNIIRLTRPEVRPVPPLVGVLRSAARLARHSGAQTVRSIGRIARRSSVRPNGARAGQATSGRYAEHPC